MHVMHRTLGYMVILLLSMPVYVAQPLTSMHRICSHPCMRDSRGTGGDKNTRKTGQPDWVITAGPQMVAD